jgi:hypothetical protein
MYSLHAFLQRTNSILHSCVSRHTDASIIASKLLLFIIQFTYSKLTSVHIHGLNAICSIFRHGGLVPRSEPIRIREGIDAELFFRILSNTSSPQDILSISCLSLYIAIQGSAVGCREFEMARNPSCNDDTNEMSEM